MTTPTGCVRTYNRSMYVGVRVCQGTIVKLTLSVVQRHVRDLHVAVAAVVLADVAVPCYAAFFATELYRANLTHSGKAAEFRAMSVLLSVSLLFVVEGFTTLYHTSHVSRLFMLSGTGRYRWDFGSRLYVLT